MSTRSSPTSSSTIDPGAARRLRHARAAHRRLPVHRPWETCMTICRQWAWKPRRPDEVVATMPPDAGPVRAAAMAICCSTSARCPAAASNLARPIASWRWALARQVRRECIRHARRAVQPTRWIASTRKDNVIYLHVLAWKGDTVILPPIGRRIVETAARPEAVSSFSRLMPRSRSRFRSRTGGRLTRSSDWARWLGHGHRADCCPRHRSRQAERPRRRTSSRRTASTALTSGAGR